MKRTGLHLKPVSANASSYTQRDFGTSCSRSRALDVDNLLMATFRLPGSRRSLLVIGCPGTRRGTTNDGSPTANYALENGGSISVNFDYQRLRLGYAGVLHCYFEFTV